MSSCPARGGSLPHCYCVGHTGPWYGVNPPESRCCWCGQTPAAEHGSYRGSPWGIRVQPCIGDMVGGTVTGQPTPNLRIYNNHEANTTPADLLRPMCRHGSDC